MTTRILPPEEWHRLPADAAAITWPDGSRPVVLERDGVIIACHVLMPVWHVEGLWVAPAYRKTLAFGRLWAAVKAECRRLGVPMVWTASVTDEVTRLIAHVRGVPLPGAHFAVPVRK